jgi:hypothetical protein
MSLIEDGVVPVLVPLFLMLALRCDAGLAWGKAQTCSDRTAPADGWRFNQARPANRLFESSLITRIVSGLQPDEE